MSTDIQIPREECPAFARLGDACRCDVMRRLASMRRLFAARSSGRIIGAQIAIEARAMGLSSTSVRRLYDEFRHGCTRGERIFCAMDWRILINYARFPDGGDATASSGVPQEIVTEFRRRCELNQRKSLPAWRQMIREWRAGALSALPWPASTNGGRWPAGCSYENLMALCRSQFRRFDLAAMRGGLGKAMAAHGPKLLTTRVGLCVGSHIAFDDVLRDMKALLVSRGEIVRVQELGAFDLFSGDRFLVHRRPQYEENGRKDSVKEREMRFLTAAWVRNTGYSPRGTECIIERGTATMRQALREFLAEHSGGKITFRLPGFTGKEQAIAGYWGSGGGNPRHKAWLESHHNLIHNEAGALAAATGHDRTPPEWLFGLEAITQGVCKALATLPSERAGLLFAPMAEYWQLLDLLGEIDRLIAWRTDHNLEGWKKCGHTCVEYRRDVTAEQWISQAEFRSLPSGEQHMIVSAAEWDPRFVRARNLAPREVQARGAAELVRFPDHIIALMFADDRLGEDLRVSRRLTAEGEFSLSERFADPEPMRFEGFVQTPRGEILGLRENTDYGVVLNPWDSDALWIYDRAGGFLGTAPRRQRVSLLDRPAIKHALGDLSHKKSLLKTPLRERHANVASEILQLHAHNAAVLSGAPITPEEKQTASLERGAARFGRALQKETAEAPASTDAPADIETWQDLPQGEALPQQENIETW